MNTSIDVRATKAWFDEDNLWFLLDDGRILAVPRSWFPRLMKATIVELENYELSGKGIGIHWDELDEDISIPNLLLGKNVIVERPIV